MDELENKIKGLLDQGLAKTREEAEKKAKEMIEAETKAVTEQIMAQTKSIDEIKASITVINEEINRKAEEDEKNRKNGSVKTKSFDVALAEEIEGQHDEMQKALKTQSGSFVLNLKTVGNMLLSSNLTGDSVATYNPRQAILPAAPLNFRDLMSTSPSSTGLYVTYKESGGEGAVATQTEGASKGQIDYDFTEVKTVNQYIAGYARFSKQMLKSLPWMGSTLPRMLLRSFYEVENSSFFTTVSGAATGTNTYSPTPATDIEALIALIANQKTAKFIASYILVSPNQMARLISETFNKGYYAGAGAVTLTGQGMTIWGVPVIDAPWVTDHRALIIDRDWLERVEVEGLNVMFSYDDADNFTKNLVTARVECYEAVNLMLPQSAIYSQSLAPIS